MDGNGDLCDCMCALLMGLKPSSVSIAWSALWMGLEAREMCVMTC